MITGLPPIQNILRQERVKRRKTGALKYRRQISSSIERCFFAPSTTTHTNFPQSNNYLHVQEEEVKMQSSVQGQEFPRSAQGGKKSNKKGDLHGSQVKKCGKHNVCCSPAVATNFLLPDCIRTVAGGKGERKERAKKRPPLYWRIKKGKGEEEGGKEKWA